MKVYIDQSGKIEQTNKDTVLAFSNKTNYSLLISARVKRQLQQVFRDQGRPRIFVYKVFAVSVFLLIKKWLPKLKEILIREMVIVCIQEVGSKKTPEINFSKIGRKSKVHDLAWKVYTKRKKPQKRLFLKDFKNIAI